MEPYLLPFCIFTIWLLFFPFSLIQIGLKKESVLDKVFKPGDYSYDLVMERLGYLEQHIGRNLKRAKKIAAHYHKNSKQTRRKFNYYIDKIEPGFLRILLGHQAKDKSFVRNHTNFFFRLHFYYIAIFPIALVLFSILSIIFSPGMPYLILLLFVVPMAYLIFKLLSGATLFFYHLIDMLFFQPAGRGILTRNVDVMNPIIKGNFGYGRTGLVIGAVGASTFYAGSGLSGISLGGGSFGGAGAGGSW